MARNVILMIAACCIMLSGCSGIKNIQDLTYIVSIGMDYDEEKDEYTVFLQGLNFVNVAKQEGGKSADPIPIFVASAKGETLNLAIRELYKLSEPSLYFAHVKNLVISKRILQHKFKDVVEEIGRNRFIRPTLHIVTTDESIEEVFNINALFNYPAVYTVIFKKDIYDVDHNEIRPVPLMKFLREYYEPMNAAKLPSVKINKTSWKAEKDYPVLYFDGYAVFQNKKYIKDLTFEDSLFLNWLMEKYVAIDERVDVEGKLAAAVKLESPKLKFQYEENASSPKFSIVLSIRADLLEKVEDISSDRLTSLIEEKIKTKLQSLYLDGIERKIDYLNAGEKWFRMRPEKFAELKKTGHFYLEENSLTDIQVKVQIFNFNSYKFNE
ncbi:Ger(x)C family germination protein [Cytobacillus firmus]|uniref:Ger(X)C family germination protein n=2 Tax=Cytobacillus TaxID=2675230 RepID=A0A366JQ96_CYTFI|nr:MULTISPECIES: Ger(x)C family spore germination protein [Cytobacillus]RBP88792.1 Ger(x)C family germination protein [Cytobacillus firmus]TDX39577.1 Ger(x)C family germination protein [Cytobacillus oceanisediminis]